MDEARDRHERLSLLLWRVIAIASPTTSGAVATSLNPSRRRYSGLLSRGGGAMGLRTLKGPLDYIHDECRALQRAYDEDLDSSTDVDRFSPQG